MFSSCNKANEPIWGADMNVYFDKNDLVFEASGGVQTVEILDVKDWIRKDGWGIERVQIKTGEDIFEFENTTKLENDGKNIYTVLVAPFKGECFEISKQGANVVIKLDENTGADRSFKVEINTGSEGTGEIRVLQKGK